MTKLLYMENSDLFELESKIIEVGIDEKGKYFILPETIIYPQGGGQPSDYAKCIVDGDILEVKFAKIIDGNVRHYYIEDMNINSGDKIIAQVDKERRMLNSRYHSAGHLIGDILLKKYKVHAVKGHQFPGEAYIETNAVINLNKEEIELVINDNIKQNFMVKTYEIERVEFDEKFGKIPYFIPEDKIFRICHIDGFVPVPCGGTHVKNTKEIGNIFIRKISDKDGKLKISYTL